ncbi:exosome complex RNA-binding protein Csl4 [archaeon]|nr:exosome complex RNA-binding protein Csl4 [archaeon]
MTEDSKILFPGDFIVDEELFLPGEGTYAENGKVLAAGFGIAVKDMKKREVKLKSSVLIPINYKRGDLAIGIVGRVRENVAFIDLIPTIVGTHRVTPTDASAVVRVSDIKNSFVKSVSDELQAGDIVRVKIMEATKYNVSLTLKGPDLGVIKAFCSKCRHPLDKKGDWLVCEQCNCKEKRKMANDYRQGRLKE